MIVILEKSFCPIQKRMGRQGEKGRVEKLHRLLSRIPAQKPLMRLLHCRTKTLRSYGFSLLHMGLGLTLKATHTPYYRISALASRDALMYKRERGFWL
jgi:hypothetical protein